MPICQMLRIEKLVIWLGSVGFTVCKGFRKLLVLKLDPNELRSVQQIQGFPLDSPKSRPWNFIEFKNAWSRLLGTIPRDFDSKTQIFLIPQPKYLTTGPYCSFISSAQINVKIFEGKINFLFSYDISYNTHNVLTTLTYA